MYRTFSLTLMVNHACNLRCSYCYTGAKIQRPMPPRIARAAVDRAVASLEPGGLFELGFFGGEPLVEARLVASIKSYAQELSSSRGLRFSCSLTTNGTIAESDAWALLLDPAVAVSISHDGLPSTHDRYRVSIDGRGTSDAVGRTLRRMVSAGREFNVVLVVRPDTVSTLVEGIQYLREMGVRRVEPSLDLWTPWSLVDRERLYQSVAECADLWRQALPAFSISWFDEKLARLARVPLDQGARCAFGDGQIAVAPSGNLFPCERLIGEDAPGHPWRLPGHALEGSPFLNLRPSASVDAASCSDCPGKDSCGATCRCSNVVRTGSPGAPDDLLCTFDRVCTEELVRVIGIPVMEAEEFDG
ncbi:MAG TPA: radical SAM protein [Planctomycetota bacterium]|jgi:uncharacterized protein|nr:radical SAM protein [Planctomycetota bacterium]